MVSDNLERQVRAAFGEHWLEALAELNSDGGEPYERERERVRMAIMTLARGDLGRLRHFTERARQDYRDVLMWAEYPEAASDLTEEDMRALFKWANPDASETE